MKKGFFGLLIAQVLSVVVLAGAVLAVYFGNTYRFDENYFTYSRINGGIFWLAVLSLIIIGFILGSMRKKAEKESTNSGRLPGLLCFFSNKGAVIADVASGLFLLSSVVLLVFDFLGYFVYQGQIFVFISLSFFIVAFGMHCILNGKNYRYYLSNRRKK